MPVDLIGSCLLAPFACRSAAAALQLALAHCSRTSAAEPATWLHQHTIPWTQLRAQLSFFSPLLHRDGRGGCSRLLHLITRASSGI
jgi:hypothetical protein